MVMDGGSARGGRNEERGRAGGRTEAEIMGNGGKSLWRNFGEDIW